MLNDIVKSPKGHAAISSAYRIDEFPMHYFAAIQRQNQLILSRILRKAMISVPVWRALSALYHSDSQTIGELADLAVLDRSSLGRLLDGMAKDGLVDHHRFREDGRARLICLSQKGRKLFEAILPEVQAHYRRVLKGVHAEEFAILMALLRQIKANTRTMAELGTDMPLQMLDANKLRNIRGPEPVRRKRR